MKLLIKFIYLLSLVLITQSADAEAVNHGCTIKTAGAKTFHLDLNKLHSRQVNIRIQDENEFVLLSENVKDPAQFEKKYNLKNLPEGKYFVMVEDEVRILIQPITVNATELVIDDSIIREIYKPVIKLTDNRLSLNMLQLENSKTEIAIIDKNGHVLYDEKIDQTGSLQKAFNLANLEAGRYRISVKSNGRTFYEAFVLGRDN